MHTHTYAHTKKAEDLARNRRGEKGVSWCLKRRDFKKLEKSRDSINQSEQARKRKMQEVSLRPAARSLSQVSVAMGEGTEGQADPHYFWSRRGNSYTLSKDDTFQKSMTHWRRSQLGRVHTQCQLSLWLGACGEDGSTISMGHRI